MKAEELRIGNLLRLTTKKNWIYGDRDGKLPEGVHSVKSISDKGINYTEFENVYWNDLENYEGIPLSPEWLIRLGFEMYGKSENTTWFKVEIKDDEDSIFTFEVWFSQYGTTWQLIDKENYCFGRPLQYVHQLQNLYFALTGSELTLKP